MLSNTLEIYRHESTSDMKNAREHKILVQPYFCTPGVT